MSMLSAQCDELRERAKVLRQGRWSDGADDARLMEDAADTISELRDRLTSDLPRLPHFWTHDGTLHVDVTKLPESIAVTLPDKRDREVYSARVWRYIREEEAENAKLRKELEAEHALAETLGHCHEHAQAENEKLRELVASVWQLFVKHGAINPCDLPEVDAVREHMRELGVEA